MREFVIHLVLTLLIMSWPACGDGQRTDGIEGVVLITVDTLRADHLGCYGYTEDTSPIIDSLARDGVVFERVLTQSPRTTQSLASLMTGLVPVRHKVRRQEHILFEEHETLAEALGDAGFSTAAFVSIPHFATPQGFDQGFGDAFFHDPGEDLRADQITDRALAWLSVQEGPFFLWVHYRDPHAPYYPPAPLVNQFDQDYEGPYRDEFHYWPIDSAGRPKNPDNMKIYSELRGRIMFGEQRLSERDRERVLALYDGEVANVDQQIGRLVDELDASGRRDRTLVIITADHGESMGEDGLWFDHGENLSDSLIRVPLVIAGKGVVPSREGAQVGLIDLAPTILEYCGLEPLANVQGKSFAAAVMGERIAGRAYFAESAEPRIWWKNPRFMSLIMRLASRDPAKAKGERTMVHEVHHPANRMRAFCTSSGLKVIFDPVAAAGQRFTVTVPEGESPGALGAQGEERLEMARKALGFIATQERRVLDMLERPGASWEPLIPPSFEVQEMLRQAGYLDAR